MSAWAAVALGLVSGPTLAARAPEPARPVDVARFYSGVWREIGRRPMALTNGCVAGATRYTRQSDGRIQVRDTCQKSVPNGPEKAIGGPGVILDPGTNAKLRVSYHVLGLLTLNRDYWVLDHDENYSWFISADPAFDNLWIYTRTPRPDAALLRALVDRARALGYDVSKLEFPAQP